MSRFYEYLRNQFNRTKLSDASSSSRDPKKIAIGRVGQAFVTGQGGRTSFEDPAYDFDTIITAYQKDSYIRIALDKYVEFMFKAGWDIVGKNQKAVDYVRTRLALVSEATKTPFNQFLREIAEDLILLGNVFIVKARASGSYQYPGLNVQGVTGTKPIAGYYIMPAQTVQIARDSNGTVLNYEQKVGGNTAQDFAPEEIIHMYYKKERGYAYGTPFVSAVIDDVKLLRQIEDHVIRLIYKNLFPLYLYKVGLAQPGYEADPEEIDTLRETLRTMPVDGSLIVPERHDVKVLGSGGQALEISDYLDYFRQRIFTGLGVPPTIMGVADSANKSTSDNLSTDFLDRIKAFQNIMADFLDDSIINELLREGGFDPVVNADDNVDFVFKEIDTFTRNAKENQVIQKWLNNLIPFEEARLELGKDSVVDESRLYVNMIATATAASTTANQNANNNATQPTNQNGKKPAVGKNKNSVGKTSFIKESRIPLLSKLQYTDYSETLSYHWSLTKDDVIELVKQYYLTQERQLRNFDPKEIQGIIHLTRESMFKLSGKYLQPAFLDGCNAARHELNVIGIPDINYTFSSKFIKQHNTQYIIKLMDDLGKLVSKALRSSRKEDALAKVVGAFGALQHRLNFIACSELMYAYNYGFALTGKVTNQLEVWTVSTELECEECRSRHQKSIKLDDSFDAKIPPFHANCTCTLTFKPEKEVS